MFLCLLFQSNSVSLDDAFAHVDPTISDFVPNPPETESTTANSLSPEPSMMEQAGVDNDHMETDRGDGNQSFNPVALVNTIRHSMDSGQVHASTTADASVAIV